MRGGADNRDRDLQYTRPSVKFESRNTSLPDSFIAL